MFSSSVPVPGRRFEIGPKFWRIHRGMASWWGVLVVVTEIKVTDHIRHPHPDISHLQSDRICPPHVLILNIYKSTHTTYNHICWFLQWMARRRRHSWGAKSAGSNFVSTLGKNCKKQESVQKCDGKQIPCQHSVWRSDSRCYARFHWIMGLTETSFWLIYILDDFDEVCVEFWEFSLCSQQTEYLNWRLQSLLFTYFNTTA